MNSVQRTSRSISARAQILFDLDPPALGWPYWPVAVLFALCWILFAWPWLSGAVTIPWDGKAQFAPQVQFLAASIARGESPFWNPYAFAGHPQIADPQSLMFSPPFLLLALLNSAPSLRAIDATVLLSVLAGGFGVLWLARELEWHWGGALIAALSFCFGASMAWRLQHFGQVLSLAYLPFALVFLRRGLQSGRPLPGLVAGIVTSFIVLGRDQVGLLCIYVLIGFAVWQQLSAPSFWPAFRNSVRPLAAGLASGVALVAIPILLTALLAGQSNRPEIDYAGAAAGSLHPALLVTSAIPHLFGAAGEMEKYWGPPSFTWEGTGLFIAQNMGQLYLGAVPLLLLIAGTVRGVLWDRQIRFFTVAFVLVTLYALGHFTPFFRVAYELLPGVKLYRRPADATFLVGGLGSILAGYTVHRLLTWTLPAPKRWQRIVEIAIVAAAFSFALAASLAFDRIDRALAPLLIAAAWLAAGAAALPLANSLKTIRPITAALLLGGLTAVDLSWNNGPNGASAMPAGELDMLEPSTRNETLALLKQKLGQRRSPAARDRVELIGLGFHWPNASLTHGLEQTLGYNPVRLKLYSAATGAGDSSGNADQRKFSKLMPSYRSALADLLGLRYVASGVPIEQIDPNLEPGDLPLIARTADAYVYENPRALPRVMLATQTRAADFNKLVAEGGLPNVDFRTTVVLQEDEPSLPRRPGSARIVAYTNTTVTIDAETPDGGWVVLNDLWHPWWFAAIDGKTTIIRRANVLFRAVEVPAGQHRVVFTFRPLAGGWRELLDR